MTLWIHISARVHKVTKDSIVKMILMSVFYHRVLIMHPVIIFLEDMSASVNQGSLESYVKQRSMNVWYPRVRTERLAKMEFMTTNASVRQVRKKSPI